MKKRITTISIIVISIIIISLIIFLICKGFAKKESVKISFYDYSMENSLEKEINVKKGKDVKKLKSYLTTIAEASPSNSNYGVVNEVIIEFEDKSKIIIQPNLEKYCYYKTEDVEKLVDMPEGLLQFVLDLRK